MLPQTRLGKRSPLGALVGVRGHPGLKVFLPCGRAGECSGTTELIDQSDASLWPPSSSSSSRSVSASIDVPRSQRSPQEVDMDELMAAMVLSSLSCSPLQRGPAHQEAAAPLMDGGGGGDFSDSGYWSVGHAHGSPAPSPTIAESDTSPATPPDEGLDMEPAPRRRRNSVKVAFRCLWPSCGKELTSVVGIKRHIRTTHLCRGGEHERCSRSEEDFYYTEINQWDEQLQQSPPTSLLCDPTPSSPPSPTCGALSRSAPSSFWQVQSEHSYQAPPPSHMVSAAALTTPPCRWTAPPTTCHRQTLSFRVRSVSVGEQWLQHQSAPCRRSRGEAKKCRKVYGVELRDQWCTACRWKKACQRFLD
ncbi:zinc finger protein 395a isoform X2 [Mugil cephalus]|nr:zinc finger protein 395a isoform X2 [Mugil cephalus]